MLNRIKKYFHENEESILIALDGLNILYGLSSYEEYPYSFKR